MVCKKRFFVILFSFCLLAMPAQARWFQGAVEGMRSMYRRTVASTSRMFRRKQASPRQTPSNTFVKSEVSSRSHHNAGYREQIGAKAQPHQRATGAEYTGATSKNRTPSHTQERAPHSKQSTHDAQPTQERTPRPAQHTQERAPSAPKSGRPTFREARQNLRELNQEVDRSFERAQKAMEQTNARPLLGGPIKHRKGLTDISLLRAKRIYPNNPELQHPVLGPQLAQAFFLIKNNELFIEHLQEVEFSFWPRFMDASRRFYEEAENFTQPKNILEWTAEQIPAEVTNLFIGEVHYQHEIPQFVSELLPQIRDQVRKQNPNRKIFLFTEFLPDSKTANQNVVDLFFEDLQKHYYYPVWEMAQELEIQVIGLESSKVQNIYPVSMSDAHGEIYQIPAGATLEGVHLRNEHWLEIMQQYRAENPDALFVFYTGSGHSFYNYPCSLTKNLPKENTFMLELTMQEIVSEGTTYYKTDNLELMNPALSFPQPVLKWSDPELVELSGFDVRIKLPSTPKPEKLKKYENLPAQHFMRLPDGPLY